ncbi:MAG: DUF4136 domain-containing protein [bacterium]|jgi:hypothetical protein
MRVLRRKRALHCKPLVLMLTAIVALLLLWSCTPDSGFNTVSDYDTVVTHYDPDIDFQTYNTYYLADSVRYITDPDDTSTVERDDELDELILSTIAENMNAYGYQRITEPEEENPPDIFVPVAVTTTKWVGMYYPYYPWWGWSPWYPGWGPGYPGYYPPVVYTYSTGTIFFDLWDFKNVDEETDTFPIIWTATINGLLSSDRAAGEKRIEDSINQAFKQSWYLEKKD